MEELHAVETKQTEEESLEEKFSRFRAEIAKLQQKPDKLVSQLKRKQEKLDRLRNGHLSQLALGELAKAEVLDKQIEPLSKEVEMLTAQVGSLQRSAQDIISTAPGSKLFNLAADITDQASDIAPQLEEKLQHFVTYKADELKEAYLAEIDEFAEQLTTLWEIAFAGLYTQKFLPEDLRHCTKPRLIPPAQARFEVSVEDVADRYRPLSRTTLPD